MAGRSCKPSGFCWLRLGSGRVGQHVFALCVLSNCGSRGVFCGFSPATLDAKRMLLAGHIKPWKNSTPGERLDPRNGLAACPPHDVAFDICLLTVNGGLRIRVARSLADAVRTDQMARQYYGQPPLRESLLLPAGALAPAPKYVDWHRQKIPDLTDTGSQRRQPRSAVSSRSRLAARR
jgi:putative restriction endonuclease